MLWDGLEGYKTKKMIETPKTKLSRLIGRKWFLSLETLAERSGLGICTIRTAVRGGKQQPECEKKLTEFLEAYKGECI